MAAMKHTPTPWIVGEERHEYDCVIRNRDNDPVAITNLAGYTKATGRANAAFIVRACNCHDELVAALRDLEGGFFGSLMSAASAAPSDGNVIVPVDLIKLWDAKLHAILAKATKGE